VPPSTAEAAAPLEAPPPHDTRAALDSISPRAGTGIFREEATDTISVSTEEYHSAATARKLLSSQLADTFTAILSRQAAALAWCEEQGIGDISGAAPQGASHLAQEIEASPAKLDELVAVLALMRGGEGGGAGR